MDSTLTVNLMLDANCNLVALDSSDYENTFKNITTHAIIEFLQDSNGIIINQRVHIIDSLTDPQIKRSLPMEIQNDGIQIYYRLLIPTMEHYLEDGIYKVANRYFCYKDEIYYSAENLSSFDEKKVTLIHDYNKVWEVRHDDNQLYWYNEKVFTLCFLNNCLINRIKESINKVIKNGCNLECSNNDLEQLKTDFLLESSFALRYLTEQGRFEDAQRLLNTISNCEELCSDKNITSNTNCNCGQTS